MLRKAACAVLALMMVGVWGCASNKEALAEKDRIINEKTQENLALRRQIQDADTTRDLISSQYDKTKGEVQKLNEQYSDAAAERDRLNRELVEASKRPSEFQMSDIKIDDPNVEVVTRSNGEVVLRVSNEVTFSSGSATLTKKGKSTLSKVGNVIKQHGEFAVSIEGHTDDTPLKATKKRWESNMNLSIARALSVRNFLTQSAKIAKSRMRVVGYGEARPVLAQKTKQARSKNRRVEIVLYKGDG